MNGKSLLVGEKNFAVEKERERIGRKSEEIRSFA